MSLVFIGVILVKDRYGMIKESSIKIYVKE